MSKSKEKKDLTTAESFNGLMKKMEGEIKKVLPALMSIDRFIRIVSTEVRKNPKLLEANKMTVLSCIMTSAQMGLEIGAHLGHSYLVPYKQECQLIIGYKGMLELVRRSGQVKSLKAEAVYTNDEFEMDVFENKIIHKPELDGDRGEFRLAWVKVVLKSGETQIAWMTKEQINKRRGVASTRKVWDAWYEEMAIKTVIKKACKFLPMSIEDQRMIAADERVYRTFEPDFEHALDQSDSVYDLYDQEEQKKIADNPLLDQEGKKEKAKIADPKTVVKVVAKTEEIKKEVKDYGLPF